MTESGEGEGEGEGEGAGEGEGEGEEEVVIVGARTESVVIARRRSTWTVADLN